MQRIKGMVKVAGETFRIERVDRCVYEVVRIRDDTRIGVFRTTPCINVVRSHIEPALMQEIARVAVQEGKTSWARRLGPS